MDSLTQALCLLASGKVELIESAEFSGEDWRRLARQAEVEGLAPLLFWAVKKAGWPGEMPVAVRNQLAGAYYSVSAQNQLFFQELVRLLQALERAGVPVLVLKGAALAAWLYPEASLRPMHDLDLLVRPEDLEQAMGAIQGLAYRRDKVTYHAVFQGGAGGQTAVELHWSLLESGEGREAGALDWFWENAVAFSLKEAPPNAQMLSLEACLLYLAVHLALKHGSESPRLLWLYDIHLILQSSGDQIDWDELVARSAEFGFGWALERVLLLSQAHFQTPLPAGVVEKLHAACQGLPQQQASWDGADFQRRARTSLSAFGWRRRLVLLAGLLFPSAQYMRQRYHPRPAWAWPIYYFYRWLNLLGFRKHTPPSNPNR